MSITTSGSITFKIGERTWPMHIPGALSLAALNVFAHAIADYTIAAIVDISFSSREDIADIPEKVGQGSFDYIAGLLFHGTTTKSKNFAVPAPVSAIFEETIGQGVLVKQIDGDAIATAYSALVGENFSFVRGRLS